MRLVIFKGGMSVWRKLWKNKIKIGGREVWSTMKASFPLVFANGKTEIIKKFLQKRNFCE